MGKPNTLAYTKCVSTSQPRCVSYECGEEKKAKGRVKYFHVKAGYVDFDGKVFGETSSGMPLRNSVELKRSLLLLEVFPLRYHQSKRDVRADLTKYDEKFLSIRLQIHCIPLGSLPQKLLKSSALEFCNLYIYIRLMRPSWLVIQEIFVLTVVLF